MDPHHLARLIAAVILFAVWLVNREERPLLYIAICYVSLAFGSALGQYALVVTEPALARLSILGAGVYVASLWLAAEFAGSARESKRQAAVIAVSTVAMLLVVNEWRTDWLAPVAAILVFMVTAWAGHRIYFRAERAYRGIGATLMLQSLLILLGGTVLRGSFPLRIVNAISYVVAAASLIYIVLKKNAQEKTQARAMDELTGLPNRSSLIKALEESVISNAGSEFGVVFVDVRGVERVIEISGTPEGDVVVQSVASRLSALCGPCERLGKVGPTHFVYRVQARVGMLTPTMELLARRVIVATGTPFGLPDMEHVLSARVGIQPLSVDISAEEAIRLAGLAAAECPAHSEWRYFDADVHRSALRKLALERNLRKAVARREFALVYQPIVDAATRRLVKTEALLRWANHELGSVSPSEFIPVAEDAGLMGEIGGWVLEEACAQAARWKTSESTGVVMSVNVTPQQILDSGFVGDIKSTLARHQLPPQLLEVELTESALPLGSERLASAIRQLRGMNVAIAVDDFGTGHSSLARLASLEIDTLKVDRSLVKNLVSDERVRRLCESTCHIGRQLSMKIVAEGVETDSQAALLRQFGVDYLQGYLTGRPVPPAEITASKASNERCVAAMAATSI